MQGANLVGMSLLPLDAYPIFWLSKKINGNVRLDSSLKSKVISHQFSFAKSYINLCTKL